VKNILIDTNAWIALNYHKDQWHKKAVSLHQRLLKQGWRYVTTNFVLDETFTGLLHKISHDRITEFGNRIRNSALVEVVHIDRIIEDKAWEIFSAYADKSFSFTDCTSFAVMKEYKIREAFTNDHHFEQSGYAILLV
jgi:predicted nucleic acid-binding protein